MVDGGLRCESDRAGQQADFPVSTDDGNTTVRDVRGDVELRLSADSIFLAEVLDAICAFTVGGGTAMPCGYVLEITKARSDVGRGSRKN